MTVLLLIIVILQLLLAAKRPVYGLAFLLCVKTLIPDVVRSPIAMFSLNSLCSIILFLCWICHMPYDERFRKNFHDSTLGLSVVCYIIYMLLVMALTSYSPIDVQLKHVIQYCVLQFLPVLVTMSVIKNSRDLKIILNVFIVSFLICVTYGIVCFVVHSPYPYNAWFESYFGSARGSNVENFSSVEFGGITGRIVGTATSDDWSFGQIISIVAMIIYMIYNYYKSRICLVCTVLCFIAVILTVRRSPILSIMVFGLVIFLLGRGKIKRKIILYGCLSSLIIIALIYFVPQLASFKNIIEASIFFWDDAVSSANEITGSSVSLRLYQLKYTITHIADSPFFGNGFGAQYVKQHPGMFGWESIVFTTLFQTGWVGLLMLGLLYWSFYLYSVEYGGRKSRRLSTAFILGSLAFSITSDTIYPFYTYFGLVLLHKMAYFTHTDMKRKLLLYDMEKTRKL